MKRGVSIVQEYGRTEGKQYSNYLQIHCEAWLCIAGCLKVMVTRTQFKHMLSSADVITCTNHVIVFRKWRCRHDGMGGWGCDAKLDVLWRWSVLLVLSFENLSSLYGRLHGGAETTTPPLQTCRTGGNSCVTTV